MKSLHFSYFAVSLLCLLIVTSSAVMSQETTTKPDLIERIENVLEGVMSDIRNVSKEIEEKVEQEIQVFHEKLDDAYQTVKLRIHNISHDVIDFLVEIEVKVDNSVYCVESLSEEIHATVANSERNLTTCIGIAYDCFKNVTTDIFNELDLVDRGYLDVKTLAEQCWGDKNNSLLLLDCIIMGAAKIQTDIDTLIKHSKALASMPENFWKVLQQAGGCFEQSYLEAKTNVTTIEKQIIDCFTGKNVTTEFPNI